MNNFDVIKNHMFEDEEVVFNSDDFNECKRVCDELSKNASYGYRYAVYPSEVMLAYGGHNYGVD
jgi:hypothetical protein